MRISNLNIINQSFSETWVQKLAEKWNSKFNLNDLIIIIDLYFVLKFLKVVKSFEYLGLLRSCYIKLL